MDSGLSKLKTVGGYCSADIGQNVTPYAMKLKGEKIRIDTILTLSLWSKQQSFRFVRYELNRPTVRIFFTAYELPDQ